MARFSTSRMPVGLALLFSIFSAVLALAREPQEGAPLSVEALRAQLNAHVGQERFREAVWGIRIASMETGAVLYETNALKLLKPASNAKLFTGALALELLGPDFRIRTSLYANNAPQGGVLNGDLLVYGRGDPSFSATFDGNSKTNPLAKLVRAVREAGIRRITGALLGDNTFFSGPPYGTDWSWDDLQYYYGAEASALSVQDNVIDLSIRPAESVNAPCRVTVTPVLPFLEVLNRTITTAPKVPATLRIERPIGGNRVFISGSLALGHSSWNDSVSVENTPLWFVTRLKEELAQAGIIVDGGVRAIQWPERSTSVEGWKEVGSVSSVELRTIVQRMMKISQNLYAQLLLLEVGMKVPDSTTETTEQVGIHRLNDFVRRAGIDPAQVRLNDGAGLSRSALVTPLAIVDLLRYMARQTNAEVFRASLPEAGTDGTLRNRLKELKGRLRAKTGSFRYVDTLAGYLTTQAGEELVFSLMLNAFDPTDSAQKRDEIDAVPVLVSRLAERVVPLKKAK